MQQDTFCQAAAGLPLTAANGDRAQLTFLLVIKRTLPVENVFTCHHLRRALFHADINIHNSPTITITFFHASHDAKNTSVVVEVIHREIGNLLILFFGSAM